MSKKFTTKYMGMELSSPVVVGACPLTIEPEQVRQMVCAGAGAIVLPSMLQEQITHSMMKLRDPLGSISESGFRPQQEQYNGGTTNYRETIRNLKQLCQVPIIGSLNGSTEGPWLEYAAEIQAAGADAIELNWQNGMPDPHESCEALECRLIALVENLRNRVSIPVAVKLSQQFSNLASVAHRLRATGVDGLVLFAHRPQWDVSIDRMHWTIRWELSPTGSLGTTLEGIVHARTGGLDLSIAASGGVRTGEDALKTMIAGADVVMVTSEIYRQGPGAIQKILQGISHFLDLSSHDSLMAFQQSRPSVELTSEPLSRLEYVDPLTRSDHYADPMPEVSGLTGDAYGHQLAGK
ncbi:dihydroorotate dehydrogenase-like protein [Planctomycetaceae bacterium SH139]